MVIQYLLTSLSSCSLHFCPLLYFYFNNVCQKAVSTPEVTDLVSLPSFLLYIGHYPLLTLCTIVYSTLPSVDSLYYCI